MNIVGLKFGRDAFFSSAISAAAHHRATVTQINDCGRGAAFLSSLASPVGLSWWQRPWMDAHRTTLRTIRREDKISLSDIIDFARPNLKDPAHHTVQIVVADEYRPDKHDPILSALRAADGELASLSHEDEDGITLLPGAEIGFFIARGIEIFLKEREGIETAGSVRYQKMGRLLDMDPVSPVPEDRPIYDLPFAFAGAAPLEQSFAICTGGGDAAGQSTAIAELASQFSSMGASLYGIRDGLEGAAIEEDQF